MPQCPNCAAPVTGASRRCTSCGHVAGAHAAQVPVTTEERDRASFRRDADDTAVPPPPRRRRSTRLPAIAAGVGIAAAIATAVVLAGRSTDGLAGGPEARETDLAPSRSPSRLGYAGARTGTVLLANTDDGPRAIDVDAGQHRPFWLATSPQAFAETVLRSGEVVYVDDGEVLVAELGRGAPGRRIGPGEDVVAAPDRRTFWAVLGPTLTEYAADGTKRRSGRLPDDVALHAATDTGFVVSPVATGGDSEFALVDFGGRTVKNLDRGYYVASTGDLVAWQRTDCVGAPGEPGCGLSLTRASTGQTTTLALAYDDAFVAYGSFGRFSPDGTKLAVFETRSGRRGIQVEPVYVDIARGTAIAVPDADYRSARGSASWSPDGSWLFFSPGDGGGRLGAYHARSGTVVEFPRLPFDAAEFLR